MGDVVRHRSHLKQQNKPYKGRSKSAKERSGRTAPLAPNTAEIIMHSKQSRKNAAIQKRKHQRESQTRLNRGISSSSTPSNHPKLVGLLAMNSSCDNEEVLKTLEASCTSGEFFMLPDSEEKIQFVQIPRNEISVLDWGKLVDVLLVIFSCKDADFTRAKIDPSACGAYDEQAYKLLSALKTQGFPSAIGVLQHLDLVSNKKQKEAKKLYARYFESEFPDCSKLSIIDKPYQVLRALSSALTHQEEITFRAGRSYLWGQHIEECGEILRISGFLKGSGKFNANQLVHVTGVGDFQLSSLVTPNGEHFPNNPEPLQCEKDPGPFAGEQTWPTDAELSEPNPLTSESDLTDAFAKLQVKTDHQAADIESSASEGSLEMSDEEKQPFEFEERKAEDLDFPDEVNTPHDQLAKDRFQRYRGLASFRTSEWDVYENLPSEYSRIYEFKEPNHIVRKHAAEQAENASQTALGMLVTLNIKGLKKEMLIPNLPVVVSSLLPHERKLSVLNFRMERWGNLEEKLSSKEPVVLNYGFRRIQCRPIYSEDSTADKHKYLREFKDQGFVVATVYSPVAFGPCNVLLHKDLMDGPSLLAVGTLHSFDPRRLIIKRILLTGYPLKIHKRKAVVRYMFINPQDIRYFKPIELFTKHGLRGHIKDSVGTHGNMKCVFNDFVKHGDIVCLPLYKRVFPKWDSVWQ